MSVRLSRIRRQRPVGPVFASKGRAARPGLGRFWRSHPSAAAVRVAGASMRKGSVMAQNADAFVDVMGLLAGGSGPETAAAGAAEPAAPAVLDCRTALLAPEDARRLPTWQPLAALLVGHVTAWRPRAWWWRATRSGYDWRFREL